MVINCRECKPKQVFVLHSLVGRQDQAVSFSCDARSYLFPAILGCFFTDGVNAVNLEGAPLQEDKFFFEP